MRKAEIGVRVRAGVAGTVVPAERSEGEAKTTQAGEPTGPLETLPAARECGSCRACCRVFDIPELEKPLNVLCSHANADRRKPGCGIYADRPQVCREFECAWKQGLAGDSDRPDRLGVMMYVVPLSDGDPGLGVVEVRPGALESPRVTAMLAEYHRRKPGRVIARRAEEPRFRTVGLMVEGKPVEPPRRASREKAPAPAGV